jgi:hypothetical protein
VPNDTTVSSRAKIVFSVCDAWIEVGEMVFLSLVSPYAVRQSPERTAPRFINNSFNTGGVAASLSFNSKCHYNRALMTRNTMSL